MKETQAKQKSQRKFSNFLINPKYQIKYVFWISSTGISLITINALIFYSFIKENYLILVDMSPMEDNVKVQLYHELNMILLYLGIFSVIFMCIVSAFGVILSHRTAGPMFHFKRVFKDIQQGKSDQRIRLRPKDDFKDVADECNRMIEFLQKK